MPPKQRTKKTKDAKEEETPSPSTSSSSRKTQARSRVSAACEACKRRKTKCSGEPVPCNLCEILGTECVIDVTLDMRRRVAMQKTIDNSRSYRESLDGLIICIRDGDTEVLQALQQVFLQDDVTQHDISGAIQHWVQVIKSEGTEVDRDGHTSPWPDGHDEQRATSSSSAHFEDHEDDSLVDPSLNVEPSAQSQLHHSQRLAKLHGRLRECSDVEGQQILASLFEAAGFLPTLDGDTSKINVSLDDARGASVSRSGSTSMPEVASSPQTYRHPALQLSSSTLTKDGVSETTSDVPFRQQRAVHTSMPHTDRLLTNHNASLAPELRHIASTFLEPSVDGVIRGGATSVSMGSQTEAHTQYNNNPELRPQVPVANLLVTNTDMISQTNIPVHLVQPLILSDDYAMSRIYTDYLYAARKMIADKTPVIELLGSNDDILVDLCFRPRQEGDKWDCSAWACEICRTFADLDVFLKLGWTFHLTRLMQWLLVPTVQNYAKLPDMMKPTPMQRMLPHIGAIDMMPLPCLRDAMIEKLRDWMTPFAEFGCAVNWHHSLEDAIERDPITGSRRLTPRFMSHVADYDNWSVDTHYLTFVPELAGRVRIHDKGKRISRNS